MTTKTAERVLVAARALGARRVNELDPLLWTPSPRPATTTYKRAAALITAAAAGRAARRVTAAACRAGGRARGAYVLGSRRRSGRGA